MKPLICILGHIIYIRMNILLASIIQGFNKCNKHMQESYSLAHLLSPTVETMGDSRCFVIELHRQLIAIKCFLHSHETWSKQFYSNATQSLIEKSNSIEFYQKLNGDGIVFISFPFSVMPLRQLNT